MSSDETNIGLNGGDTAIMPSLVRKPRGTVTADADVTAMAKISKIVNDLGETDRLAVIHWFGTKFITTVLVLVMLAFTTVAFANNGEGTPRFCERHGCGLPENQESPCDCTQTPTECPEPTCPDVTCEATDCSKTVVNVTCPAPVVTLDDVVFPNYYPCRRNNDGSIDCPRRKTPRRLLVPESEIEKYLK